MAMQAAPAHHITAARLSQGTVSPTRADIHPRLQDSLPACQQNELQGWLPAAAPAPSRPATGERQAHPPQPGKPIPTGCLDGVQTDWPARIVTARGSTENGVQRGGSWAAASRKRDGSKLKDVQSTQTQCVLKGRGPWGPACLTCVNSRAVNSLAYACLKMDTAVPAPPPHSAMVARLSACSSHGSSGSLPRTAHTSLAATLSATLARTRRAPTAGGADGAGAEGEPTKRDRREARALPAASQAPYSSHLGSTQHRSRRTCLGRR